MRVTFIVQDKGYSLSTALPQAASYDAAYLRSRGHEVSILPLVKERVRIFDFVKAVGAVDLIVVEGAGWVPISKLRALTKACKQVIVRVHAAPEFLYAEAPRGIAMTYVRECVDIGVWIGVVSPELCEVLRAVFGEAVIPLRIAYPMPVVRSLGPRSYQKTGE